MDVARNPDQTPSPEVDWPTLRAEAARLATLAYAPYSGLRVGAAGCGVFTAVESRRDASLYDFAVNPGHFIHLDEWVHSPFCADGRTPLRSGMAQIGRASCRERVFSSV